MSCAKTGMSCAKSDFGAAAHVVENNSGNVGKGDALLVRSMRRCHVEFEAIFRRVSDPEEPSAKVARAACKVLLRAARRRAGYDASSPRSPARLPREVTAAPLPGSQLARASEAPPSRPELAGL